MEAGVKHIQEIFLNNITLRIPYFQRAYVWKEDNWERFISDMLDLLETKDNYFLGSVILKKAGENELGYEQYDVVDGQQRLTTLVVFSKILYLMAAKNEKFISKFMQDDINAPILSPNRRDSAAFDDIVKMDSLGHKVAEKGQVRKAFDYFYDRMDVPEIRDRANTLITKMSTKVYFVRIIVDENENEQQIFDTINSLGQDLTTGELLKNYLFNDQNVDIYDEQWVPVFERRGNDYNYWTDQITKGRLKANNIETFFYNFMLIKMQDSEIRTGLTPIEKKIYRKQEGLFESYKKLIQNHGLDKNELIKEIVDYGKIYHDNFNQAILTEALVRYSGMKRLSFLLFAQGAWTPVPYILYILKAVNDKKEQVKIFEYLETYLVRRIICKSKNNNYSDLFSENLIGQGVNTFQLFKNYVNDANNRGALLMPSDDDVRESLMRNDLQKESLVLLYLLESKLNDKFSTEDVYDNSYEVFASEPIMPIKYDESKWPLSDNITGEERDALVKTLGNQIFVRGGKLKPAKSGLCWNDKKEMLKNKVQNLRLGQVINNEKWNDDLIAKRNNALAGMIIKYWRI